MSEEETTPEPRRRPAARLAPALLVATALAIVTGRLLLDARAALRAGEEAAARNETPEAIRRFADAIRLYVPGSPFAEAGLERLERLSDEAAAAGDPATERRALEAARGALLGARSFYTPMAERLSHIDERLAALLAAAEDPRVAPGASLEARRRWHAARLSAHPGPGLAAVLLALGGFALWLGAARAFFTRGLDAGLRLRRRAAAGAAVAFALGLALFVVGLRLA